MQILGWIVSGLALSVGARGQTPVDGEFSISEGTGVRRAPAVAALAGGDFVVVWEQEAPAGIRGRRVAADGSPRGEELRISTFPGAGLNVPDVASAAAGGGFVVVWESAGSPGSDSSLTSIQARRFDFDGEPTGSQFQVNTVTRNRQTGPAVAMDAAGGFAVVWGSVDGRSRASIQGQRFGPDGARRGGQFQIDTVTGEARLRPSVAMAQDGDFVAVWGEGAIRGRRFAADGAALGKSFRVDLGGDFPFDPTVAIAPGGEFVVVWQNTDFGSFGANYHTIRARTYSAKGEPVGPSGRPIELHQDLSVSRSALLVPDVEAPVDGEFVVVWGDSYYQNVAGNRFTTPGLPLGAFEAGTSPGVHDPALAADPAGRLLVVWSQEAGSGSEIRGRGLELETAGRTCRERSTALCVQKGRFTVEIAWRDFRGATGSGRVVKRARSADSGLFWFFSPENWELLVKVLDGCAINGHYWVFAAATTNVEYTLRVTDEARGTYREYVNVLGRASPAVTDTRAFATCP